MPADVQVVIAELQARVAASLSLPEASRASSPPSAGEIARAASSSSSIQHGHAAVTSSLREVAMAPPAVSNATQGSVACVSILDGMIQLIACSSPCPAMFASQIFDWGTNQGWMPAQWLPPACNVPGIVAWPPRAGSTRILSASSVTVPHLWVEWLAVDQVHRVCLLVSLPTLSIDTNMAASEAVQLLRDAAWQAQLLGALRSNAPSAAITSSQLLQTLYRRAAMASLPSQCRAGMLQDIAATLGAESVALWLVPQLSLRRTDPGASCSGNYLVLDSVAGPQAPSTKPELHVQLPARSPATPDDEPHSLVQLASMGMPVRARPAWFLSGFNPSFDGAGLKGSASVVTAAAVAKAAGWEQQAAQPMSPRAIARTHKSRVLSMASMLPVEALDSWPDSDSLDSKIAGEPRADSALSAPHRKPRADSQGKIVVTGATAPARRHSVSRTVRVGSDIAVDHSAQVLAVSSAAEQHLAHVLPADMSVAVHSILAVPLLAQSSANSSQVCTVGVLVAVNKSQHAAFTTADQSLLIAAGRALLAAADRQLAERSAAAARRALFILQRCQMELLAQNFAHMDSLVAQMLATSVLAERVYIGQQVPGRRASRLIAHVTCTANWDRLTSTVGVRTRSRLRDRDVNALPSSPARALMRTSLGGLLSGARELQPSVWDQDAQSALSVVTLCRGEQVMATPVWASSGEALGAIVVVGRPQLSSRAADDSAVHASAAAGLHTLKLVSRSATQAGRAAAPSLDAASCGARDDPLGIADWHARFADMPHEQFMERCGAEQSFDDADMEILRLAAQQLALAWQFQAVAAAAASATESAAESSTALPRGQSATSAASSVPPGPDSMRCASGPGAPNVWRGPGASRSAGSSRTKSVDRGAAPHRSGAASPASPVLPQFTFDDTPARRRQTVHSPDHPSRPGGIARSHSRRETQAAAGLNSLVESYSMKPTTMDYPSGFAPGSSAGQLTRSGSNSGLRARAASMVSPSMRAWTSRPPPLDMSPGLLAPDDASSPQHQVLHMASGRSIKQRSASISHTPPLSEANSPLLQSGSHSPSILTARRIAAGMARAPPAAPLPAAAASAAELSRPSQQRRAVRVSTCSSIADAVLVDTEGESSDTASSPRPGLVTSARSDTTPTYEGSESRMPVPGWPPHSDSDTESPVATQRQPRRVSHASIPGELNWSAETSQFCSDGWDLVHGRESREQLADRYLMLTNLAGEPHLYDVPIPPQTDTHVLPIANTFQSMLATGTITAPLVHRWDVDYWSITQDAAAIHQYLALFKFAGLLDALPLDVPQLARYALAIRSRYNRVPYHNFTHALTVAHHSYLAMRATGAGDILSPLQGAALLVAALGHDVGHPGVNNGFLINVRSAVAHLYNDQSVLENYHAAMVMATLRHPRAAVFDFAADCNEAWTTMRSTVIHSILGTDMAKHFETVERLQGMDLAILPRGADGDFLRDVLPQLGDAPVLDGRASDWHVPLWREPVALESAAEGSDAGVPADTIAWLAHPASVSLYDRLLLTELCLHSADLSVQSLPWPASQRWSVAIVNEMQSQARLEAVLGLPVTQHMANLSNAAAIADIQRGFCEFVLLPLWRELGNLYPALAPRAAQLSANVAEYKRVAGILAQGAAADEPSPASSESPAAPSHSMMIATQCPVTPGSAPPELHEHTAECGVLLLGSSRSTATLSSGAE